MKRSNTGARDDVAAPVPGCVIDEKWNGPTVVVSVSGVLDMLTSPELEPRLTAALNKGPAAMIVDLTDVEFLASAGMGVLVTARDLSGDGVRFAVVADGPATSRPLTLVGLADLLGLQSTLEDALAFVGV